MLTGYEVDESLSLTANLKQAFRKVEWLSLPYRRVNLLMAGKRFTFIPLEYFEDEQADTIFYHNFSQQENETVLYNILHKDNIVVLFGMDKSAFNYLHEQHPEAHFYAQASPFIEYFSAKSRLGNNRKMYVNLRKEQLTSTPSSGVVCYWPIPFPARLLQTASITCCTSGNSWDSIRKGTNCT